MKLHYTDLPDNTVLSLIAPTASGKTDLACRLYQTGRFELISVDSALIYRDMNIGTAKPSSDELLLCPHHLVNIIDPTEYYSVASFVQDVQGLIDACHKRGKIPLLVGGTMMYFMALFDGLSTVPESLPYIRQQVMDWLGERGVEDLYRYLQHHDPAICQKLKVSDTQRITRAVEVLLQTGTPMSVWQNTPKKALCHNPSQYWLALSVEPERAWLHERIAQRLEKMWQAGLVDEVIGLIKKYPTLTPDMPSMRCVGYRQVLEFLALNHHPIMQSNISLALLGEKLLSDKLKTNKHTLETAKNYNKDKKTTNGNNQAINVIEYTCQDLTNKVLYATRQLAKRQATWQRQLARLTPTITKTKQEEDCIIQVYPEIMSFDSIIKLEKKLLS